MHAAQSDGGVIFGQLLLDGEVVSALTQTDTASSVFANQMQAGFDTSNLPNGTHTIQCVGFDGTFAFSTQLTTIQTNNDFSAFYCDDGIQTDMGRVARVKVNLPAGTVQWMLQILDSANNVIRSWSSTMPTAQLAWDGTDAAGAMMPDDIYTMQLIVSDGQQQKKAPRRKMVKGASPYFLALLDNVHSGETVANTVNVGLEDALSKWCAALQKRTSGFSFRILDDQSTELPSVIHTWMTTTVGDFYIYSHGYVPKRIAAKTESMRAVQWHAKNSIITFVPYEGTVPAGTSHVENITLDAGYAAPYNFVFLDCCHSAGGNGKDLELADPLYQSIDWFVAFGLDGTNTTNTMLGWNGNAGTGTAKLISDGTILEDKAWTVWRKEFWNHLINGSKNYQTASALATSLAKAAAAVQLNSRLPWNTARSVMEGFKSGTFPY